jgi:outer membrane murein-binding lipoprotein Lpp
MKVQDNLARFRADLAASIEKRDKLVQEANVLNARVQQLQGAVYALEELENDAKKEDVDGKVTPISGK